LSTAIEIHFAAKPKKGILATAFRQRPKFVERSNEKGTIATSTLYASNHLTTN